MKRLRILVILGLAALPLTAQAATRWKIIPEQSSIAWAIEYGGKTIKGNFTDFDAYIAFEPGRLGSSRVHAVINMGKVTSDDPDAAQNLPDKDWFDAPTYPQAVFGCTDFQALPQDGQFVCKGELTMHGIRGRLQLPFAVNFYDNEDTHPPLHFAQMSAQLTLKRLDYNIGSGDFARTDVLADPVTVTMHIVAQQLP